MRMKVTTCVLLGSKRHGCPAEVETRKGHRVNNVQARGLRPASIGSEDVASLCSGGSDLGGKQTWRPERLRNDCRPETLGHTEVAVWAFAVKPTLVPGDYAILLVKALTPCFPRFLYIVSRGTRTDPLLEQ